MNFPLTIRNQKDLETIILRVATPLAQKIAQQETQRALKERFQFRAKVDKSNARSSYETTNQGGNQLVVTGSRSDTISGGQIPALNSLLNALASIGFITDNSS